MTFLEAILVSSFSVPPKSPIDSDVVLEAAALEETLEAAFLTHEKEEQPMGAANKNAVMNTITVFKELYLVGVMVDYCVGRKLRNSLGRMIFEIVKEQMIVKVVFCCADELTGVRGCQIF